MHGGVGRLPRIVEKSRRNRRLGAFAVEAALGQGDRADIIIVLVDRHLRGAIVARRVERADRQGDALRRQRLHLERRLGRGVHGPRAVFGEAVGDQQVDDLFRHHRLEDGLLELRPAVGAAGDDLELVAVGAGQQQILRVARGVGAAVVVGAGVDLRGVGRPRHLRRIHRQLGRQRVGFLARFGKFSHEAAVGRDQRRADVIGLRLGSGRVGDELDRRGEAQLLGRRDRAAPHQHRIAGKVDDRRDFGDGRRSFRSGRRLALDLGRRGRRRRPAQNQAPAHQAGAEAKDRQRGRQGEGAAASGHGSIAALQDSRFAFA